MRNMTIEEFAAGRYFDFNETIRSASDKEIIFFLGLTGAGTSAVIASILGKKFDLEENDMGEPGIKEKSNIQHDRSYPESGYTTDSLTLYAQTYETKYGIEYCDCPGFDDKRGGGVALYASISTQLAMKAAKSIKGLVIVLDWHEITISRNRHITKLCDVLINLLDIDVFLLDRAPILFLFNKIGAHNVSSMYKASMTQWKEAALNKIAKIIKECEENSEGKNIKLKTFLSLINKNNTGIVDPIEGKIECGIENCYILKWFQDQQVILESSFDFNKNSKRNQFSKTICSSAILSQELILDLQENISASNLKRTPFSSQLYESASIVEIQNFIDAEIKKLETENDNSNNPLQLNATIKKANEYKKRHLESVLYIIELHDIYSSTDQKNAQFKHDLLRMINEFGTKKKLTAEEYNQRRQEIEANKEQYAFMKMLCQHNILNQKATTILSQFLGTYEQFQTREQNPEANELIEDHSPAKEITVFEDDISSKEIGDNTIKEHDLTTEWIRSVCTVSLIVSFLLTLSALICLFICIGLSAGTPILIIGLTSAACGGIALFGTASLVHDFADKITLWCRPAPEKSTEFIRPTEYSEQIVSH